MTKRVVFHIDANSAFLSWTAAHKVLILGEKVDLREIPSAVVGNRTSRHSIILAKSGPAKKYGIHTGEPLFQALEKCPNLTVVEPDYGLYRGVLPAHGGAAAPGGPGSGAIFH